MIASELRSTKPEWSFHPRNEKSGAVSHTEGLMTTGEPGKKEKLGLNCVLTKCLQWLSQRSADFGLQYPIQVGACLFLHRNLEPSYCAHFDLLVRKGSL